jgi:hypothetical protein
VFQAAPERERRQSRPRKESSRPLLVDEGFGVGVAWGGVGVGVGVGVSVAVGLGVGTGVAVEAGIGGTGEMVVVMIGGSGVTVSPDAGTGSVDGAGLEVGPDVVLFGCRLAVGAGDAAGMRGTGTMLWPTATAGTWLPAAGKVPVSGIAVGSSVGAWMPTPERRMASGKSLGLGAEPPKPEMAPRRKRRPAISAAAANRICSTPLGSELHQPASGRADVFF